MKIDLHNHSTHSDGAWDVKELIDEAKQNGVDVMALTDHDSCFGVTDAKAYGEKVGLQIIAGIEVSTTYNDESIHVLGYFPNNIVPKKINDFANNVIKTRHDRAINMMKNIEKMFNLKVDYDYLFSAGEIVTRGNMARTLVRCNENVGFKDAGKYVGNDSPAYIPASKLTTKEGIDLLHSVGALAILAHPVLVKKTKINELLDLGFDGIEYRYPRNTFYDEERFKTMAIERNLFMTSGSDCHGDASHATVGTATYDYDEFKPIADYLNIKIKGVNNES